MNAARIASIPVDHIIAEVAAFPLASEEAFRLGAVEMRMDVAKDRGMGDFWRAAEHTVLRSFPAMSVDEVVAIRDRLWFGARTEVVSLGDYLCQLAAQFLRCRGAVAEPYLAPDDEATGLAPWRHDAVLARRSWRWLSFALPPDLLLAALADETTLPVTINTLSPVLEQCLRDQGYAETHLHIGAAVDFPTLWVAALRAIAEANFAESVLRSPGAAFADGAQLAPWLLRAGLGRYVLAAFLNRFYEAPASHPSLRDFLGGEALRGVLCSGTDAAVLRVGLNDLASGRLTDDGPSHADMRALYGTMTQIAARRFPQNWTDIQRHDSIALLTPYRGPHAATPEMLFVARGLDYLRRQRNDQTDDLTFARLFWQAIRVRALFYRHIVQRPMTPGLQWFTRTYGRLAQPRQPLSTTILLRSAARLCGAGHGLRSLEVRTAPEATTDRMLRYVDDIANAVTELRSQDLGRLEAGVVLHFTKLRGGGAAQGVPNAHWQDSEAAPAPQSGYRYASYYRERRLQALAFGAVLTAFPYSLRILRGVDVCTDELGVPTWVVAPLLRYVRDAGAVASGYLRRRGIDLPNLRTTVHAGEDFLHLLGGLRRVDEAIRNLHLAAGDRIGHGVALGTDARSWAANAGRIAVMVEERLLDLTWEWSWYSRHGQASSAARLALLEREIRRLSERVFKQCLSPYEMERLVDALHEEPSLRAAGFPPDVAAPKVSTSVLRNLQTYLTSQSAFEGGRRIEWVEPAAEADALVYLQCALRQRVGACGLTVEVNPTSNLLIANLSDLSHHPLWRLRPPQGDGDAPPVAICVGSDDPMVFATGLRDEYGLLHDTLVLSGLSDDEATRWIDAVRRRGLDTRFTLPATDLGDLRQSAPTALTDTIPPIL